MSVPVTSDAIAELDETVNLSSSEPGGCAALGSAHFGGDEDQ